MFDVNVHETEWDSRSSNGEQENVPLNVWNSNESDE